MVKSRVSSLSASLLLVFSMFYSRAVKVFRITFFLGFRIVRKTKRLGEMKLKELGEKKTSDLADREVARNQTVSHNHRRSLNSP